MHFGSQLGVNELNLCLFQSLKVTISVALRFLLFYLSWSSWKPCI